MILFLLTISLFLIFFYIFFVSKKFSPIPYFPSNIKDKKIIMKAISQKNVDLFIDLGAGDGWVIFEAAKSKVKGQRSKVEYIAVEINPILLLIMHIKRFFHPNRKNIVIVNQSMFAIDYKKMIRGKKTLIYLYISPWHMDSTLKKIGKNTNVSYVSYLYELPKKKYSKKFTGVHNVYVYDI